ncbi:MAG: CoA-acylating methylmalonate-semialdehyde dehydrogenase, partial [Aurantimicrobium sp.]
MSTLPVVGHWIDGAEVVSTSGRTAPVYDPALGEITKEVALANQAEIKAAIESAAAAFPAWRDQSLAKRQQIIFKFRELLNERKGELAEIITSEHGKVLSDALGEITRGQEVVEFACGLNQMLKGEYSENASTGVDVYSTRQPLGVVGVISPFNFPAMVPMWFFPVAIAAGNTVVLKPSEKDPTAAIWMAKLFKEAGLPDGVFTVLNGDKESVDGLLEHPAVQAISFVGSTPIAQYIYETAAKNGKRVQALGGAKNHMLVLPDADLELVADSAINAGFGSAGERCMAISVIVAVEPVADALIEKIVARMGKLTTGDGRRNCDMGPLVTKVHRDKVASYIDIAIEDGATVVHDGRNDTFDGADNGFWLGPTLIDNVPTTSKVYTEEIFGPVLSVVRVKSYDEGVELINNGAFGNGTAIFTNDGGAA